MGTVSLIYGAVARLSVVYSFVLERTGFSPPKQACCKRTGGDCCKPVAAGTVKPWLVLLMHRTLWPADPSSVRGKLELKAAASKAADEREGQLKRRRDVVIEQASPAWGLWS